MFERGSARETLRVAEVLRRETVGGALLVVLALVALAWANSPWGGAYFDLRDTTVGPSSVHLHLSLGGWAADGLLAIFFFVAGLELKREFVAGDLRDPRRGVLPVAAALGGMAAPALLFVAVNVSSDGGSLRGWAIPTATDIAFALAVLAVIGSHLPTALRTFLLTLAVVDDLLAITVIAIFYTSDLSLVPLVAAVAPLAVFTVLVQHGVRRWWLLLPLALATWTLVHASGVHATVAGILLGFAVPVLTTRTSRTPDDHPGRRVPNELAEHFEHRFRPVSAGLAVPAFAFFAAGVDVGGRSGLGGALSDPITLGVIVGLVVGKPIGICTATFLLARFTRAELDDQLRPVDVLGLALLASIGFTVSLLLGELAYGTGTTRDDHVKVGVLAGSLLAAALATAVLGVRNHGFRRQARGTLLPHTRTTATGDDMPPEFRSVGDVAETLALEFEGRVPVTSVTEVVSRLSQDGAVSLDALARRARLELVALTRPARGES